MSPQSEKVDTKTSERLRFQNQSTTVLWYPNIILVDLRHSQTHKSQCKKMEEPKTGSPAYGAHTSERERRGRGEGRGGLGDLEGVPLKHSLKTGISNTSPQALDTPNQIVTKQ